MKNEGVKEEPDESHRLKELPEALSMKKEELGGNEELWETDGDLQYGL